MNWHGFSAERNWCSSIVLPILKNEKVVATFNIVALESDIFDKDEIALLEEAAEDISFALSLFEKEKIKAAVEKELVHTAYRLSQAQRIAHIGSWEINFKTGISIWSDESCRIYGLDESDRIQTYESWLSFIHPDDLENVQKFAQDAQLNSKNDGIHHRIIRRDGSIRHIFSSLSHDLDIEGVPIGLHGIAHDVTTAKLAEISLMQSEANLKQIIDLMPQSIFVRDLDGNFIFINQSFANLYGMDKQNISSPNFSEINFGTNSLERFVRTDLEMYKSANQKTELDVTYTDNQGNSHLLNVLKVPFSAANNPKPAVLGVVTEVTEQRKAESEKNRLISEIMSRNKNLEQFSYITSHNLRGPVANIIGLATALCADGLSAEEEQSMKEYLVTAGNKLDGVIRDLNHILEMRENLAEHKSLVFFEDIVQDVKTSLRQTLRNEQVTIHTDFNKAGKMLTIRSFIYSIFYNLVTNSIKYRKPGQPPEIWISGGRIGNKIHLIFKDNGIGIDLKKAGEKMFGLYKRFHPHVEGKGIGLYLVRTQVETLGGSISVISEPDAGAEFIIDFETEDQS